MHSPLVSVNLVIFKEPDRIILKGVRSGASQTHRPLELTILDNSSKEEDRKELVKEIERILEEEKGITFSYIPSKENTGFARAHNMLINKCKGDYIVLLNADAWMDKHFVEEGLEVFRKHKGLGAVQSKMIRYDFERDKPKEKEGKHIIDATGLVILKNRRIIARGQGERDSGQYEKEEEIFGADGACPMYARKALEEVKLLKYDGSEDFEYLDESFFAYKEDVDIAWRMQLYGWGTIYNPKVIAYHARGSGESAARNYIAIVKERQNIRPLAKEWSWRNQRLMQVKNELLPLFFLHLPFILFKEIASFVYIILFERYALRSMRDFFHLLPRALKKRKIIMQKKKAGWREMRRWFA